ncbi:MAG: AMP-binding protein, partial [Boseongicola sp.]|nr:AMP-binding protein [Boseongicola sp.]
IIARGYLGNPDLTAQAFEDGWLRTGDLATAHQDGFVTISGRSKDLIISGGVNIHPQEVTDCLLECDGVADAIAFGLPHGVWGEQVAAAICARPGAGLDRHQILQYCLDRLAPHKVPRILTFVDSLPRNAAGKILVKQLRAECQAMDMSRGSSSEASLADQVIEQASEVFGVSAADLSLQAEPATTPGWDSFAHLTLITALEARFDLTFSAQEILRVDSLSHLVDLLVARQSRVPEGQALTVQ